jgi:hypothetical protein
VVAVLAVIAGGVAGVAFSASTEGMADAADTAWVLTKTEVNPFKDPPPPGLKLTVRSGHVDFDVPIAPQVEFDIDYAPPPKRVAPGTQIVFKVTAKGRLTGGTDTQGFRVATPILLVDDRWVGTPVEIGQSCVDPIGAEPISCTPPVSRTGSVTTTTPASGTTFKVGIGMLNCGPCYVRYTYTLQQAGTKPGPTPKPTPPGTGGALQLAISWSVPRRYGLVGKDGLLDTITARRQVSPSSFPVDLVVRPRGSRSCKASDTITWKRGGATAIERTSGCRFRAQFPKEGRYTLSAALQGKDGARGSGEVEVIVQDWLVFGLGDSNGSGEGAPDIPSPPLPELDPPVWQSVQCDRSAYSYQAQTARSIENADPQTSVTFVHLACSGASIVQGLLGAYEGINPDEGETLGPQVLQLKSLAGKREIDAVVISIGVNDLGFAALVEHCILYPGCQNRGFPSLSSPTTLGQVMQQRLDALPGLYDRLSRSLKRIGVAAPRVYLTEYFDSTRDQNGRFCDPLIRVDARTLQPYTRAIPSPFLRRLALAATSVVLDFDRSEAEWAYTGVLQKLNAQVRAAASKHGWGLVTGVAKAFERHGYCSDGSWIAGLVESLERQHDHNGTVHALPRGNAETAKLAVRAMREDLYPDGPDGPPRRPR